MVKAFVGLLIILFPLAVFFALGQIAKSGFAFEALAINTMAVSLHLGIILAWYRLKASVFRESLRCSACGRNIPLTGRQRCRKCGFRWDGHYYDKCPNCGAVAGIINCPHCELSQKKPWFYDHWHKFN